MLFKILVKCMDLNDYFTNGDPPSDNNINNIDAFGGVESADAVISEDTLIKDRNTILPSKRRLNSLKNIINDIYHVYPEFSTNINLNYLDNKGLEDIIQRFKIFYDSVLYNLQEKKLHNILNYKSVIYLEMNNGGDFGFPHYCHVMEYFWKAIDTVISNPQKLIIMIKPEKEYISRYVLGFLNKLLTLFDNILFLSKQTFDSIKKSFPEEDFGIFSTFGTLQKDKQIDSFST